MVKPAFICCSIRRMAAERTNRQRSFRTATLVRNLATSTARRRFTAHGLWGAAPKPTGFQTRCAGLLALLVVSHALNPADAGRVVTRLLEMENYRITALIPLDDARGEQTLSQADARLVRILMKLPIRIRRKSNTICSTICSPSRSRSRVTAINCPRVFPPAKPTSWLNFLRKLNEENWRSATPANLR